MKVGVFLARMQPMHKAHIWMVKKALEENDKVLVVLGSSNKEKTLRNPLPFWLRKQFLEEHIYDNFNEGHLDKLEVIELPDWGKENGTAEIDKWGEYLYYNVVSRIRQKHFTIYYSDNPDFIKSWFAHRDDLIQSIGIKMVERSELFNGLSATKVREAFESDNKDYIEEFCPQCIVQNYHHIRNMYLEILKNPKEDFAME